MSGFFCSPFRFPPLHCAFSFLREKSIFLAYATRPIKKGDEITDGYSGIFSNIPQDNRAQIHSRYHFDCLCKACEKFWPLKHELPSKIPKNSNQLKMLLKEKSKPSLNEQEKFEILKKAIIEAYLVLPRPHLIICQLEDEFYNLIRVM